MRLGITGGHIGHYFNVETTRVQKNVQKSYW